MPVSTDLISRTLSIGPVNVGTAERLVTGGLGGLLVLAGVNRGGLLGTVLAAGGAVLLARAGTGHCPARQALEFRQNQHRPRERRSRDKAEVLAGPNTDTGPSSHGVAREDRVEAASDMSFPASDPPSHQPERVGAAG